MSLAIFNINDAGLQLSLNGDLIDTSRGYAVLDGNKLMVGEEAAQNTKLLTGWTNNKFWNQLTTTPIKGKKNQIRHHADLAFAHLEDLWEPKIACQSHVSRLVEHSPKLISLPQIEP